ncbi:hypothetical protein [Spirosoma fluminis]
MNSAEVSTKKPIGFQAKAKLIKLAKPVEYRMQSFEVKAGTVVPRTAKTDRVVISYGFRQADSKPETKVFPANKEGMCVSWLQIGEALGGIRQLLTC